MIDWSDPILRAWLTAALLYFWGARAIASGSFWPDSFCLACSWRTAHRWFFLARTIFLTIFGVRSFSLPKIASGLAPSAWFFDLDLSRMVGASFVHRWQLDGFGSSALDSLDCCRRACCNRTCDGLHNKEVQTMVQSALSCQILPCISTWRNQLWVRKALLDGSIDSLGSPSLRGDNIIMSNYWWKLLLAGYL